MLKKCSYNNEAFLRLLIHHLLVKMNTERKGEIDLEYSHENTKTKLIVLAYLTDKEDEN